MSNIKLTKYVCDHVVIFTTLFPGTDDLLSSKNKVTLKTLAAFLKMIEVSKLRKIKSAIYDYYLTLFGKYSDKVASQ